MTGASPGADNQWIEHNAKGLRVRLKDLREQGLRGPQSAQEMKDLAAFLLLESILLNTVPPDHLALLISELLDDPRRTRPRLGKRNEKPSKVRAPPQRQELLELHDALVRRVEAQIRGVTAGLVDGFHRCARVEAAERQAGRKPSISKLSKAGGMSRETVTRLRELPTYWALVDVLGDLGRLKPSAR